MIFKKLFVVMGIACAYFSGNAAAVALSRGESRAESEAINPILPNFDPIDVSSVKVQNNIAIIVNEHGTSLIDVSDSRNPTMLYQFQNMQGQSPSIRDDKAAQFRLKSKM